MKLGIYNKIFRTVKISVAKEQEGNRNMQTELRPYVRKSKELLEIAEIIRIEHNAGKHSIKSIDELKQQTSDLKSTESKLQHSLKELSQVPASLEKLEQGQSSLRREVNVLNQKNRKLFLQAMRGEITYEEAKDQREINYEEIKEKNSKINKNDTEIKNFEEKVQELHENIQNNSIDLKKKVAKLEFLIKSIEKGPAPKPPAQPSRPAPLAPPIKIKGDLKVLAGYFNNHGAYDTGKQYLREKLDLLNNFGIIKNDTLQNLQNSINKPDVTGQELVGIINTATESIDRDLKSRMEKPVIGNRPQTFEERFADKFAGRVENMEGNNKKDQTFADRVKENTKENSQEETYRL